jgi:hypothetical protein
MVRGYNPASSLSPQVSRGLALSGAAMDSVSMPTMGELRFGVTNFTLTTHTIAPAATAAPPATKRLTAHDVQQQRTAQMAAKHPVLEAAVNALELELLD